MEFERIENYSELQAGDQIATLGLVKDLDERMKPLYELVHYVNNGVYYFHHGIYTGKNMEVVHFHGEDKSSAEPRKVDLKKFDKGIGGILFRVKYTGDQTLAPNQTVKMAEEYVSYPKDWSKYDIFFNNCETFATYLKTGEPRSEQGKAAWKRTLKVAEKLIEVLAKVTSSSVGKSVGSSQ